ncbi:MAG: hypothetical protein ACTS8R_08565 [Arsenophonus sp. NC-QC1-MAG3]
MGVNQSAIVKFAQKVGVKGFSHFKASY